MLVPLSQISELPPPDAARQPSPLKKVNLESHVNHLLPTCEEAASRGEQMGVHQQFVIPGTRSAFPWFESYQAASASL